MRAKAEQAARRATVPVRVVAGLADELGLADGSADAAVASLVLCTVPDPGRALGELHRVLRPGGELRFLEHVRSGRAGKARWQSAADHSGVWPLIGGGCHCSRDTPAAIRAAGFEVTELRELNVGPAWAITNPHVLGRAVR